MSVINMRKYANAILYLCWQQGNHQLVGKKKLVKLLYYVDFDRFEYKESMKSITGDVYRNWPMGPVPDEYESVILRLIEDKKLQIGTKEYDNPQLNSAVTYTALCEPDLSCFDEDDQFILQRVNRLYGSLSGNDLENLTHNEAPWRAAQPNEELAYETAFYRETDFEN